MQKRYRYAMILLKQLVITDFKLRYQGSVLGYAWSLLRPLLLFVILYLVFVKGLKIGGSIPNFPIYLLLGIVMWNFFSEMTSQSLSSIVSRGDLIRKIRIPRWIIVLSSSISALINLGLNLLVVLVFMLITHVDFMKTGIFFPIILLEIYIFALGVSLFLAAAFVKYRDVEYIWEVITQAFFYLTPIIYPLSVITDQTLQKILLLNPMAQAMQDARSILVTKETITMAEVYGTANARLISLAIVVTFFLVGLVYFKRKAKYFAENI
ncbi:ABC transporter permease [Candidatus Saccharibacteria bacterium]|nr:ABC transporter permease [Candidatus Saccharibacteria bacterium]